MIDFMTARSTLSALTPDDSWIPATSSNLLALRASVSNASQRNPRAPRQLEQQQAACLIYNALVLGRSLRFFQELRQCANCSTRIGHGPRESKTIQC